mmetsp:Transcript_13183/g.29340  ORF Transcript_13183/g.29340 Transcript_13183/m.29340 type:complete len:415 (-) Transcript_13183:52-1296(-)
MASISLIRSGVRTQSRAPSVLTFQKTSLNAHNDCSSGSGGSSSSSSRCYFSSGHITSASSSAASMSSPLASYPLMRTAPRSYRSASQSTALASAAPMSPWLASSSRVLRSQVSLGGIAGGSGQARGVASSARLDPEEVLNKARDAATAMGFDPTEVYEPYAIVDLGQQALLQLQGLSGSSGLAVAGAAILLRLITLPWNRRALQKQCDRGELLPAYIDIAKALQAAQLKRGNVSAGPQGAAMAEVECQKYTMMLHKFSEELKFSPWQGLGYQFGVLMPLYIWGYFCLRGIVAHPDAFRGLVVEPTLWLDSLVLGDPWGALPAISAIMVLANVEVNTPTPRPGQEENALYMKLVIRGAALTFAPITTLLPSAILIFMGTNALYTAAVTFIFRRFMWKPPKLPQYLLLDPWKAKAK